MTLSQRLTRAGLSFIVFGTAVSLMPTNGMAFSATDGCTTPAQSYSIGINPQETTSLYTTSGTGTRSVTLNKYLDTSLTIVIPTIADSNSAFNTVISGSTVTTSTTTAIAGAIDQVTATFSDGHVVTYTVTAN